jgi:hypothetical protein
MGFNTPVLLLNDAMHEIEDDPTFAKRLAQASATAYMHGKSVDVRAGGHMNAASVLPSAHADVVQVIAFGGNHATTLLRMGNGGHHYTHEEQVRLIRELADQYGFRLVRKSGTKVG